ncbi:MAG: ABC transporter permease, partial [Candidatus Bathyarchaeia archaeon]
ALGGGLVAEQTTSSWVRNAMGEHIVLIAHKDLCQQYISLWEFQKEQSMASFNYTDEKYLLSQELVQSIESVDGIGTVDFRLILMEKVAEIQGVIYHKTTGTTETVGDKHVGNALVIGVQPQKVLNTWFIDGYFLNETSKRQAVIGDSLARKMFSVPLVQKIAAFNDSFTIVGVCVDMINNGESTYVPLEVLQNDTGISDPNIALVKIEAANRTEVLNRLKASISTVRSDVEVIELDEVLEKNLAFLGYMWSSIMILPIFSLATAICCLLSYVMLAVNEQKQEFGFLRAIGADSKAVIGIISWQNLIFLISTSLAGTAIGIMLMLLILIPNPIITPFTLAQIIAWMLLSSAIAFAFSLYPALSFRKKPILEMMSR